MRCPATCIRTCTARASTSTPQAAGLEVAHAEDCTALARRHLGGVAALMRQANDGQLPDVWFAKTCDYLERGLSFGVSAVAYKPV